MTCPILTMMKGIQKMSKRFGRNQKRKLNEKILILEKKETLLSEANNDLKNANKSNQKLNEEIVLKLEYFEQVFKNVEEVLGEYFIGLPAKEKENIFDELPVEMRDCFPPKMRAPDFSAKPQATMIRNTVLTLSRYNFESHIDQLQQKRHFYLTQKDKGLVAYYIDERDFKNIPSGELTKTIAKLFVDHIKTGK